MIQLQAFRSEREGGGQEEEEEEGKKRARSLCGHSSERGQSDV